MNLFLFFIAYSLLLPFVFFNAFNVKKKGYFRDTAVNIDRFGNREFRFSLNKYLITETSINRFGNIEETISGVLGKNQVYSRKIIYKNFRLYFFYKKYIVIRLNKYSCLTKTGNFIANFLDTIDENHCINSINK